MWRIIALATFLLVLCGCSTVPDAEPCPTIPPELLEPLPDLPPLRDYPSALRCWRTPIAVSVTVKPKHVFEPFARP